MGVTLFDLVIATGGWMLWPGGSVDLTKGSILLGPCSDFGLLEGWPQVLRHCDCFAASAKKKCRVQCAQR